MGTWSIPIPVPEPPPGPIVVRCPHCGSVEIAIRTSRGQTSQLTCRDCTAAWQTTASLRRVLIADRPG